MAGARSQSAKGPSRGEARNSLDLGDVMSNDIFLSCPDLKALWKEREDRTRATMQALDPALTRTVLPAEGIDSSTEDKAAIRIQSYYRGHLGRKLYLQLLLQQFNKDEEQRRKHMLKQVEEGELLLENHRLEVEFEDNKCVRRNRLQRYESRIITIQRAWRNYKRRKEHVSGDQDVISENDDDDDDLDDDHDDDVDNENDDIGDDDNNDGLSNDVNGNHQLPSESDISSLQTDLERETNQSVEGEKDTQKQDSSSSGGESQSDPVAMTSVGRSKKGIAMLHDLGSSVELDDKACYETSPETPSRRRQGINRLSLAEELAAMEERVMEDSLDFDSQNEESDYYASSSCVTSPEGEGGDGNEHIGKRPVVSLSRNIGGKKTPSPSGEMRTTEGSPRIESFDQNKNTNDFNANASSCLMEETELTEALAKLKTKLGTAYMDNQNTASNLHTSGLNQRSANRVGETTQNEANQVTHSTTSSLRCGSSTTTLTHARVSSSPSHSAPATIAATTTTTCNRGTNTQTLVTNTSTTTAPCTNFDPSSSSLGKRPIREGGAPPRGGVCKSLAGLDTALPVLDWDSLEKHLAKMEKEEEQQQSAKQTQKNSRQEILRKLAMGADEEAEGDIYGKGRDKLSARLQGGMNLQICFVNENLDSDEDEGSKIVAMPSCSTIPGPIVGNRDSRYLFSRECSASSTGSAASPKAPSVTFEDIEDFESKKAHLQEEARIAWAKAEPLAKLQMELERQQRKASPSSDLCRLSGLGDLPISLLGKRFQYKTLSRMSVSKLQIILNDLHSQIERLNEELVQCLLARDSYKREQESRLIDIEDLNRLTAEQQQHSNQQRVSRGRRP